MAGRIFAALLAGASSENAWAQEKDAPPSLRRAPALCLSDKERASALRVGLVSLKPAPLCAPSYQIVEIRNTSASPVSEAQLFVTPPLGKGEMRFEALPGSTPKDRRFVEYSVDEGASWVRAEAPAGAGTLEDPLVFSSAQIPPLRRLGAVSENDDSILIRWRASLGEKYGEPFASEALLGLSGSARDACGRSLRAPQRLSRLALDRPALIAGLEGRNVTRGGAFGRAVRAAPGDEIEWRMALENIGEAAAPVARATLSEKGRKTDKDEVFALDGVVPGARRSVTTKMRAGDGCEVRDFRLTPSWGCAAPSAGRAAALSPLAEGYAVARLLRAPDPNAIVMKLKMTGEDGAPRPGDRARVTVELRNDGPPAFEPRVQVTLPDGYVPRRDRPIEIFATHSALKNARWASAQQEKALGLASDQALILLEGGDGQGAILDPDAFAQLRFDVRRVRRSQSEDDRLSARTLFRSACDVAERSRPARLRVEPRQSDLTASLTALDPPLVSEPGAKLRFRAAIANSGEEAAERLTASLKLGSGWSQDTPAPKNCKPDGEKRERRFVCTVAGAARPGSSVSFDFDAIAGPGAAPPDASLLEQAAAALDGQDRADFSIVLNVEAYQGQGEKEGGTLAKEGPISEARAESGAIGFRLRQRIVDENGDEWPRDKPIDLGDAVAIEVDAEWWGAGRERIGEPTLIQTLPKALSIQSAQGEQDDVTVTAAVRAAPRQVLWGLSDMEGGGRFKGRVLAIAVDATRPGGGAEPSWASAEADAVFVLRGQTYGVDALVSAATSAAPLNRQFRKPDLRMELRLDSEDGAATPTQGAAQKEKPRAVVAGGRVTGSVSLANAGAAPAYVDWIELSAPPYAVIEPFGSDGLDNDGDGRVDEGDEEETAQRVAGKNGETSRLRWVRLPDGGARRIGEARSRLSPGAAATLPIAFRIDQRAAPGRPIEIKLKSQFGARPFAQRQEAGRAEISIASPLVPLAVEGALALTETRAATADPTAPVGLELRRKIRQGERVEHRAILRMPPGRHDNARFVVSLPPALAQARARALRKGHDVNCVGGGEARLEKVADADVGIGEAALLIWPLGDCVVGADAPEEARTLLLDFVSAAEDADPTSPPPDRVAWRKPEARSWFERSGEKKGEVQRYALGQSALSLSGPLLSAKVLRVRRPKGAAPGKGKAPRFDAGDAFEAVVEATNSGDSPSKSVALQLRRPKKGEAIALDCGALRIVSKPAGAFHKGQGGCGGVAVLNAPLEPGQSAQFTIKGRLRADAQIGAEGTHLLALSGLGDAAISARASAALLRLPLRGPEPPELRTASTSQKGSADKGEVPELAIGDPLLLRATHRLPEGSGEASLAFRLRVVDEEGAPVDGALEGLRLVEASVERSGARVTLGADPGRLNDRRGRARAAITGAVGRAVDADGWLRLTLPLGEIARRSVVDGPADVAIVFEAVAAIEDAAPLRAGFVVEAEALTEIAGAAPVARGGAAALLAEPALTIAAKAEGREGAVRLGEKALFSAEVCNIGSASAFNLAVEGRLPPGFRLDPNAPPRFALAPRKKGESPRAPRPAPEEGAYPTADAAPRFGSAEILSDDLEDGARLIARSAGGAGIAPGRCARLSIEARASGVGVGALSSARFAIASYASRPGEGAGRRYLGGPVGRSALQTLAISVAAPPEGEVAPGAVATRSFSVAVREAVEPLRLSAKIGGVSDVSWSLFVDANGNGELDASDPPWRDGVRIEVGGELALLAMARIPDKIGPRWRRTARLSVTGLGASGRIAAGLGEFSVRAAEERLGSFDAKRLMAVDRDCDGLLADEIAQDAVFEAAKDAAPGECVTMRIFFQNAGAAAVEGVSIEDQPPQGLTYERGGARVIVTPRGLIGGQIEEPLPGEGGRALGPVRFDFVGALAPGDGGAVEYRVRLPAR